MMNGVVSSVQASTCFMANSTLGHVHSSSSGHHCTGGLELGEPASAVGFVLANHVSMTTFRHESLNTLCLHEIKFWLEYH